MTRIILFLYPIFLSGLFSCSGTVNSNQTAKVQATIQVIEKTEYCTLDSANSYEIYIPERSNPIEKLPLLVIIDAHGSGKFALEKFKPGVNQYPAILVASNLVKNGFVGYEGAIKTLVDDVHQKYPVNESVFMAGFSGGARMSMGYGLVHPVNGLILCGALADANQINAVRCPVISISGMDDFNFIETAQYLFQEQLIPGNLKIELTNASHNWPDSLMLSNAFGFLQLSGHSTDISKLKKSQITAYSQLQQARIDTLKMHGDFLKAALVARNMSSSAPFNNDKTFASTYNNLKTSPGYKEQLNQLEKCLKYEIGVRPTYIDAFQTKDSLWWKNEIKTTNEKIETEQNTYIKDMHRRIKGFWGIACYSFSNQAIQAHNVELLNKIVTIYRWVEPENPYVLYFSAFPYFWKGNNQTTLSILKKTMDSGFSDLNQIKKDFPESITSKL